MTLQEQVRDDGNKPFFACALHDVTTIAEDTIHLSCQVSSQLSAVSWFVGGMQIVESSHHKMKYEKDTVTLLISECDVRDTGQYTVRISNQSGEAAAATCFVDIHDITSCKDMSERNLPDAFMIESDLRELVDRMEHEKRFSWIEYDKLRSMAGADQVTALVQYTEDFTTADFMAFLKLLHSDKLKHTIEFIFGSNSADDRRLKTALAQREVDRVQVDKWRRKGLNPQAILRKIETKKKSITESMRKYVLSDDLLYPLNSRPLEDLIKLPRINLVVIGKTGTGKSATANTLMGKYAFKESMSAMSATQSIAVREAIIGSQSFKIIDVPGFLDTERETEDVQMDVAKIFHECPEGIHIFFYVKPATAIRFTREEQDVKQQVQDTFLEKVFDHTVLILTHAAGTFKRKSLRSYLADNAREGGSSNRFNAFVEAINYQVIAVENKPDKCYAGELTRRSLVNVINKVLVNVNHEVYTHDYFRKAGSLRRRQEEVRDEARLNRVKSDVEHFQNAYLRGKRLAKDIVDSMLLNRNYHDLRAQQRHGFRILQRDVEKELSRRVPDDDNVLFLKLSNDNLMPFTSIAIESVYERTSVFLTRRAQEEGDKEYCEAQKQLLEMKPWIPNVMDEVEEEIRHHFDPHPRDLGWFVGNYRDIIVQKIVNHLDGAGPPAARMASEVEYQIKVLFYQLWYEHLISNVYKDFDDCTWTVIQEYVQKLTRSDLENLTDEDYENILEKIREKLSHESNVYLATDYMMEMVKQRVASRQHDLQKLAKMFACTIL